MPVKKEGGSREGGRQEARGERGGDGMCQNIRGPQIVRTAPSIPHGVPEPLIGHGPEENKCRAIV